VYVLYITSLTTKVLKEELLTTETTNGGGVAGGSDAIVVMSDEGVNREPRVRIDVVHVVHVNHLAVAP
jgi:hypothetical protein